MSVSLNIYGKTYTGVDGIKAKDTNGNTRTFVLPESIPSGGTDTSDATITSGDQLLDGVTAYGKGTKYTGTIQNKTTNDVTEFGGTVTIPSGYYSSAVTKSAETSTAGYVWQDSNGKVHLASTKWTNNGAYNNSRLTSVPAYGFYSCQNIAGAEFTKATTIGSWAFAYCSSLATASFPVATSIANNAFTSCSSLVSTYFPEATYVGAEAFTNCLKLSSVEMPKVTEISRSAFVGCSKLTEVSFPLATELGYSAFCSCSNLTTAIFPLLTRIKESTFYGCTRLHTTNFDSVSEVDSFGFCSCNYLYRLSLPKLTRLGGVGAFGYCSNLTTVYLLNSVVASGAADAFYGASLDKIYVRQSLLSAWKSASYWSQYSKYFSGLTDAQIEAL